MAIVYAKNSTNCEVGVFLLSAGTPFVDVFPATSDSSLESSSWIEAAYGDGDPAPVMVPVEDVSDPETIWAELEKPLLEKEEREKQLDLFFRNKMAVMLLSPEENIDSISSLIEDQQIPIIQNQIQVEEALEKHLRHHAVENHRKNPGSNPVFTLLL